MTLRVLVTGASGFTGRHFIAEARQRGALIYGLSRQLVQTEAVTWLTGDLVDSDATVRAVRESAPDYVVHLASRTPANAPRLAPREWISVNPLITFNLLDAVRIINPKARVLIVSSSAVYGHVSQAELPISEQVLPRPATMYGVSKATQELIAARFIAEYGLPVIIARPFNLIGPGEPPLMLTSTLARQVAAIAAGQAPPVLRMRHRATSRDFSDVRDVVRAYWALLEAGDVGEIYNVCSGTATSIGEIADCLMRLANISAVIEETSGGPTANDVLLQVGDNRKITASVGWRPAIDLMTSLADVLASFVVAPASSNTAT